MATGRGFAIDRLAGDSALRERLADAAAAVLRDRDLSWRQNASRVLAIGADLIERRSGDAVAAARPVNPAAIGDVAGKQ